MKFIQSFCIVLAIYISTAQLTSSVGELKRGVNGGIACAACTVVVGLAEQIAEVNERNITEVVNEFCSYFPKDYALLCDILIDIWGPAIIEKLIRKETADVVCYSLGICHVDSGQGLCRLFPSPKDGMLYAIFKSRVLSKVVPFYQWRTVEKLSSICDLPAIRYICKTLEKLLNELNPAIDFDKDKYSIFQDLRGDSWRGADCNDFDEDIHPGIKPINGDKFVDTNCNGISGINFLTGKPYENELCDGTNPYGLIYIGDSIGAHFHFPAQWMTPTEIHKDLFKHFAFILGNEFDWPETSFATGYENITWPTLHGYTDSLYVRLRQHNLCNHRDFQNIAVNGADSQNSLKYITSLSRNKTMDKPVIAIYAMMGNDVCTPFIETMDDLTTPKIFRKNVLKALAYLENMLPPKSHVILVGLVNGSFIYETMAPHFHPIGQLRHDVTYDNVYDWFNCMRIGPCYGWMNKNETIRNKTTQRAFELSDVLKIAASSLNYKSFQLHYIDNPIFKVFKMWENAGNELWRVLEPVDSLHPVQVRKFSQT